MTPRFMNEVLLIDVGAIDWAKDGFEKVAAFDTDEFLAGDFWGNDRGGHRYRPYEVEGGILRIPVKGALLNNFPFAYGDYATGYEYIKAAIERGLLDSEVKGIALIVDSPGGVVSGAFDLSDYIFAARSEKPIRAVGEHAYSAAYLMASSTSHFSLSRSGGAGSIGIITQHVDISGSLEQDGVAITLVYAGKHKADGNPYGPLPQAVRDRMQARIDSAYSEFVALVARNRGMSEADVRATEAAVFMPKEAISNGLADVVGSSEESLTAFAAAIESYKGERDMAAQDTAGTITMDAHETALAAAVSSATETATKAGATDERARIVGILDSDEGKARPTAALAAATTTSMTLDEATAFLGAIPTEATASAAQPEPGAGVPKPIFDAAMSGSENPNLEAGVTASKEEVEQAELMSNISAFGLAGFTQIKQ